MLLNQWTDLTNAESVKNALKNCKTWHIFFQFLVKNYTWSRDSKVEHFAIQIFLCFIKLILSVYLKYQNHK